MARPRTNLSPVSELAIDLDRNGGDALHRQIEASIRERIRSGLLPAGIALPPTRALAAELDVSRGVVVEACAQLVAEGYLTSRSGGYTQVAHAPAAPPPATAPRPGRPRPSSAGHPAVDFGYGRANLAAFPRGAWLRSVRRVLTEAADERLGYLDGRGAVELRSALAAYLNRVRGTNADPETIVITNGYAQAVSLLVGVLAARGAGTLAVEDPSASDDARPIADALGLRREQSYTPRSPLQINAQRRWRTGGGQGVVDHLADRVDEVAATVTGSCIGISRAGVGSQGGMLRS